MKSGIETAVRRVSLGELVAGVLAAVKTWTVVDSSPPKAKEPLPDEALTPDFTDPRDVIYGNLSLAFTAWKVLV